MPTQIIAEQRRLPVGFLDQIVEYRVFAAAVRANEADPNGWDQSPMRRLAQEIEMAIAADDIQRANGGRAGD